MKPRSDPGTDPVQAVFAEAKQDRIHYELNLRESRLRDQLIVDFMAGTRPMEIDEAGIEALPSSEDRTLLRLLLGNVAEDRNRARLEHGLTYSRSVVRPGMYDTLLVRLCASKRFFRETALDPGAPPIPLSFDDGDPFGFVLQVTSKEEGLELWGRLVRGDHAIDLSAPELFLSGGLAVMFDRLIRLDCNEAFDWIYRLHRQGPIVVPHEARDEFLIQLAAMPDLPEVELPSEVHWSKAKVAPRPRVVFASSRSEAERRASGHRDAKVVIGKVEFDYAGQVIGAGSSRTSVADQDGKRIVRRDLRAERTLIERLKSLGLEAAGTAEVKVASRDLGSVIRTLVEEGWYIEAEGAPIRMPTGNLRPKVSSGIDWFDLQGELDFGDLTVGLPELLEAAASGTGFVRLSDGSRGILPDWLDRYASLAHAAKRDGNRLRFSPSQVGILDALLTGQDDANTDVKFDRVRRALADGGKRSLPDEPQGFFGKLRPYQKEGLAWLNFLLSSGYGGCLADDMGLGKTVQVLAMLQSHRKKKSLIVVPRSLVHNWIAEAAKFTPALRVVDYTGADRKKHNLADYDLVVTTYGTLRQDVLDLVEIKFFLVILDEAQAIKNPTSQAAKACRLIRADHRLAITGTPIENNLDELWSIFEYLSPGMLGRFEDFSANGKAADEAWLGMLANSLKPFMLRRTKDQVLKELPKKTEQSIVVELKESEREAYDELRDWYRNMLTKKIDEVGFGRAKIHVLEALLRLRQAACHPGLIDAERMDEPSAKIDTLMEMLEEVTAAGHKALVFSQFTTLLEIVRRRVEKSNIRYCYLDGATRDRRAVCEQFQTDPELKVFLISLKAGGCGLNLTASDYVFILDPWWNPAVESQAIDRAHRMGQKNKVFAYRLIASETVEDKIVGLQDEKRKLADAIVTADGKGLRDLTAKDLELLFRA